VLISGGTGSGKTSLARVLDEVRIKRGGNVVVFVCKSEDRTIRENYKGWTRWTEWHRRPGPTENRILLWPKVQGKPMDQQYALWKKVFHEALMDISAKGRWTVHLDDALFMTSPIHLNFGREIAMMHQMLRSADGTILTLAQRPSHLPLEVYACIDHAFVGASRELSDVKRLANLDGKSGSRELQSKIMQNGKHDFLWVRCNSQADPERFNMRE
jgi:energy-coupling factor transporter ATP-binding protein EcfA2